MIETLEEYKKENKVLSRKLKLMEQSLSQFTSIKTNYDVLIKKLEEKDKNLRDINNKLEDLVSERTSELENINKQLEKNLRLLEELSTTDALTNLRNRRSFDEIFAQEFNRAKRQNYEFNFLIIDIDYFKKYNDFYGHRAGDEALKAVGKVLNKFARRANDFVFRYGGEEFVYISCFHDFKEIETLGNAIRKSIYSLEINHEKNPHNFLSVSIGGIVFKDKDLLIEEVFKTADDNLYISKENGRNKVTISI
ncbi:GGDEF domain-containing protein [Poseidonibacter lekithochrous]|uniref:GGDEF domain-containing protein n=1 Tax=Poseidonibacter lekithochrous TaxID=1904463 RepID=UPI0008FC59E3|nr:GGDEF domain-containing protein [Poseidonibacter lekithochrous]QKJ24333.1 diguanylate cyclase [Poseidonibacter lekithochrous]